MAIVASNKNPVVDIYNPLPKTAWDSETCLIERGRQAAPLVCVTWHHEEESAAGIVHHKDPACYRMLREFFELAAAQKRVLVGHHHAYDAAVVCERFPDLRPVIFAAYKANGITDTMIRQWLLDNAAGRLRGFMDEKGQWHPYQYALEDLARRIDMKITKDAMRLSYGYLIDTPLDKWPARVLEIQQMALESLPALNQRVALIEGTPKAKRASGMETELKALKKKLEGIHEMLAGSTDRATEYAKEDATATLRVAQAQEPHAQKYLKDQFRQARAYFALQLQAMWGLMTDAAAIDLLAKAIDEDLLEITEDLVEAGLVRTNGKRDTKAAKARMIAVCKANGLQVIRTDGHFGKSKGKTVKGKACPSLCSCGNEKCRKKGKDPKHTDIYENPDHPEYCTEHVGLDKDACEAVAEFDDVIESYGDYTTLSKVKSNDLVVLASGSVLPVHTRWGFAGTGRITSSSPNITNQSNREGIREAFVAREGYVYIECDYPQLELYTLAQCCVSWFGYSRLAEVLLEGKDPHTMVAARLARVSYEDAVKILDDETHPKHDIVKKLRKQAKPFNFGKPGGMGDETLMRTTRKQMGRKAFAELDLTAARAFEISKEWKDTWPESVPHFKRIEELVNDSPNGRANDVETLFTGRFRSNATFCATANNGFQALGSDCAKNGVWLLAEAAYAKPESPLFNTRPNVFVHDENLGETPWNPTPMGYSVKAHAAAYELGKLMADGANEFLPDVPIAYSRMVPVMMKRWFKKAESIFINPATGEWSKKRKSEEWVLVPAKVIKDPADPKGKKDIVVFDGPAANDSVQVAA